MQVELSGGPKGGEIVEWPEGQEELILDGCIYRRVSQTQAVFAGVV